MRGEGKRSTKLIGEAVRILEAQHPMTLRQLFYRLVSLGMIPNDRKYYQLMSRLMTTAREDGRCDFEYIADRSRPEYKASVFNDAADYAEAVKRSYRKDYWSTQSNHIEVWVEKDAIIGAIEPVTNELGVIIRVGRGFVSTTKVHDIATHFRAIRKPITVLYLGDHDPSGQNIESDLYERVLNHGSGDFAFKRLAILPADIGKFNLPPLRIKKSDTRAAKFAAKYGKDCVELDALPPDELRRRLRSTIEGLIDMEQWNRAISVEQAEFASIQATVAVWQNLARVDEENLS